MNEDKVFRDVHRLRSPARLRQLEVERVVDLCLEGVKVRRVLDVGTGSGVFAQSFAARGLETSGIDPNGEMLELARELVPGVEFHEAFAERIPFPDSAFDLAFLGLVLHESEHPGQVLRECRRVARQRTAVLEWPFETQDFGPPVSHRLRYADITELALAAGFQQFEMIPLTSLVLYRMSV